MAVPGRVRWSWLVAGALLAVIGLAWPWLTLESSEPIPLREVSREGAHGYRSSLKLPLVRDVKGDDNDNPRRSRLHVTEDGKPLGPAHSLHADIRSRGEGRFSHWQKELYFSASDNSDPRFNGREYAVVLEEPLLPVLGWVALLAGAILLVRADAGATPRLRSSTGRVPLAALDAAAREYWMHGALFVAIAAGAVWLGPERSGWIVATQPFDQRFATNSLLGSSWIMDGSVLHRDNYASLLQVEFLAGGDVAPDTRMALPVHAFAAILLAPIFGVVGAIVGVNLIAWAVAIWLTHRFTLRLSGEAAAAKWAALFAVSGTGFVVHVLDLSGQLVAFTLCIAAVVAIFESGAWERPVALRTHLAIGILLALAGLHPLGALLVAGYAIVALRRNPVRHVIAGCSLALAVQVSWGLWAAEVFALRHGAKAPPIAFLASAKDAIAEWGVILASPGGEIAAAVARRALSLSTFEMPLLVVAGVAGLAWTLRGAAAARSRVAFTVTFLAVAFVGALVLAPSWAPRGPLMYGTSVFFFAGAGVVVAALVRRREHWFAPAGVVLAVLGIAWSTAHMGNILGPVKGYVSGIEGTRSLFAPGGWEVQSLTRGDPVPRLFGGQAPLSEAGLTALRSVDAPRSEKGASYSSLAFAPLVIVTVALVVALMPVGWPSAVALAVLISLTTTLAGQLASTHASVHPIERIYRIPAGRSLTYHVIMSGELRKRLLDGIERGALVTLFGAFYNGEAPPSVDIDQRAVRITDRYLQGNWALDRNDLRAALRGARGILRVTFPGGDDVWIGGWQRRGLPGRQLTSGDRELEGAVVLPAVELRLIVDTRKSMPVVIAF